MANEYEDLFNFSLDILCINGLDGYFRLVNPAFERILGYSKEEIMSKHFIEFIHPDDQARTREEMKKRVAGTHTTHFQNRYRRKDGSVVWIEWTSFPVSEKGVMYAVGHDITERKRAEELRLELERETIARQEAEKQLELRNNFIAIASHELKTPITSLQLHTQLIAGMLRDGSLVSLPQDQALKLVDLAQKQLNRLTNLSRDLLDASRLSEGLLAVELQDTDLSALVREVAQMFRLELEKSGSRLDLDLEDAIVGRWDPFLIEQVIVNLLGNAIKFGRGQPIALRSEREGEIARLIIMDQGIGIKAEDQEKLFQRFGKAVSIRNYEGLGLGLYIAQQFVAAHGGTIRVESKAGQGSTFTVELYCSPRLGETGAKLHLL